MAFCAKQLRLSNRRQLTVFQETHSQQLFAMCSEVAKFLSLPTPHLYATSPMTMRYEALAQWCVAHGFAKESNTDDVDCIKFVAQHTLRSLCWDRFPNHHHAVEAAFRNVFDQVPIEGVQRESTKRKSSDMEIMDERSRPVVITVPQKPFAR